MSMDSYSDCSSSDGQESPTELCSSPFSLDVEKDTHSLIVDYIGYRLRTKFEQSRLRGLPREYLVPPKNPSVKATKLRTLAMNLEGQHDQLFKQICLKVDLSYEQAKMNFQNIAEEIFSTGLNWGRVVSLITFAGAVAHHFIEQEQPEMVCQVVQWLCEFIHVHLIHWIEGNGGWVGQMLAILYFSVGLHLGNKIASDSFYEERRIKTY